jgi:hypothetical protein
VTIPRKFASVSFVFFLMPPGMYRYNQIRQENTFPEPVHPLAAS